MPRFSFTLAFDSESDMYEYMRSHDMLPAPAAPLPDAPLAPPMNERMKALDKPMKATPPTRPKAEPKAEPKLEPKLEPKAEEPIEPKAEEPKAEPPVVTAEQVSAAIIKFLPKPEAKAAAAGVLKAFGVQRGKDLKPEQRADFLVALRFAGAEFGIEV